MLYSFFKVACLSLTSVAIGFLPNTSYAGDFYDQEFNEPGLLPFYQAPLQLAAGPRSLTANPPAGTIGRTYDLPSREIPADKHPRIAMIDVHVRGASSVRVQNINVHREEDDIEGFRAEGNNSLWRFETKSLIPGIPYLYKVVFRFSEDANADETVRYVRLIPGRIVELVYDEPK